MQTFITILFIYLVVGLIQISLDDKTGDTSRKIAELLGKSIKWPKTVYEKLNG